MTKLLSVTIRGSRSKAAKLLAEKLLSAVGREVKATVRQMEESSGQGHWAEKVFKGGPALLGIRKHLGIVRQGNNLSVIPLQDGKRGQGSFLWIHHQSKRPYTTVVGEGRAMYVPITKRADRMTAEEAYAESTRFGGTLREGKIVDGVLMYYTGDTDAEGHMELEEGWPDFLWLPRVKVPRRRLWYAKPLRANLRKTLKAVVEKTIIIK